MAKTIIGVMGPGANPTKKDIEDAYEIGKLIAKQDWILLTGGRNAGVMDAASKGAKEVDGLTVGILPGSDKTNMSQYVDIPIVTNIGSARNNVNVLSSDIIVACGCGLGTSSEIMLALKAGKEIILINQEKALLQFLQNRGFKNLHISTSPKEVIAIASQLL